MLEGFVAGLIIAFVLSLFGIDEIVIQGSAELFNLKITEAGYYLLFALIGLAIELFNK